MPRAGLVLVVLGFAACGPVRPEPARRACAVIATATDDASLADLYRAQGRVLIVAPDAVIGCDCEPPRSLAGATEDRALAGDVERRDLGGDIEGRNLAGATEGRALGGDTEGRDLGGATEGRNLAGATEGRALEGGTEARSLAGATEDRGLAGRYDRLLCESSPACGRYRLIDAAPGLAQYDGRGRRPLSGDCVE